jgi:hypothetical protein
MAAKIPQDGTRGDKLVGPLTLRQFLYVLGGAAAIFIAYQYYALRYLYFIEFALIVALTGPLAIALAFAQVNGRPFGVFLLSLLHFLTTPKSYSWHKEPRDILPAVKVSATDIKDTRAEIQERKSGKEFKMQLEKLASILDMGGTINQDNADAVTTQVSNLPAAQPAAAPLDVEDVLADSE